ncbi:MAG: reactive intermediate/imine deaminase [Bacteroidetes bacterium GWF2_49_14]|nr:MAG: reactive intermediate/imine deaminase [Bacteroidetes bacterium GWF2_49_14]HBB92351.1 reactive intermediate/imine deaminase [Bacteroidales bacterium]
MKKVIKTTLAPAAVGPYSQAIEAGGFLFISGQIPLVPATGKLLEGSIVDQTHLVMNNIGEILKEAGYTYEHLVKCTCFLANIEDFKAMNEVYGSYFPGVPPARAAFQVARLPLGAQVEIDAIAYK